MTRNEELIDSLEGCIRQLKGIMNAGYVGEAIQFCTNQGAFCTEQTSRVFWDERLRHIRDEVDLAEKRLARAKLKRK